MKGSVFWRTLGGYVLVILVVVTAVLVFALNTVRSRHIATLTRDLERQALVSAELAGPVLADTAGTGLQPLVERLGEMTGTRVTVIDTLGVVLADSEEDPAVMENHGARPEIMRAYLGETGSSTRFSRTVKQEMLYVAVPIRSGDTVVALMRVSLFLSDVNALLSRLGREIVLVAAVLVVVALLAAFVFARSVSRPVRKLAEAARRVGGGDFEVRVSSRREDEFGDLTGSFNDMVARLHSLVDSQARQAEALNIIIDAIQEGLLVLEAGGRIRLANRSFTRLYGEEDLAGKEYWDVVRDSNLGELVKRTGPGQPTGSAEVSFQGRQFVCSAAWLESAGETVVTFHDVTEMYRMAQMKKDLVVNVSHELRTPLTAIKGFIETMEEDPSGDNRRFLKIIGRHTERLISIVKDLLLLSELEEKGLELEAEPLDLAGLIRNVLRTFERRSREKGLRLEYDAAPDVGKVRADPFRMDQVFINLIDNALKYTEAGEVKVSVERQDGHVRVRVTDTGIGIPKEQLPRVFERFYVTDKARSRKLGGTGLGLSIVKHIVLLHGGTIDVQSQPGVGSTFTIVLPAA